MAALAGLLLAGGALAQEPEPGTRVGEWTRLRREKAMRAAPKRPGPIERALVSVEQVKVPSVLLGAAGFRPRAQFIATGTELAGGLRLWRRHIGGSPVGVHASAFYSLHGYEYYDLQVGRIAHDGDRLPARSARDDDVYELGDLGRVSSRRPFLYGSARYRHYPQTAFYGLGAEASATGRSSYLHQDAAYEVVAGYEGPRGAVSARAGLLQAFVGPGTEEGVPTTQALYDDQSAPGLDRQPDFLHLAASAVFDRRDHPRNPHRGGMIAVGAARFAERGGSEFTFNRLSGDARGFASLGSPQRVLALRALLSADRPAEGARVPFYLQEPLGGSRTLRGFRTFRFRGETLLLLQAEYRWEAWPALELALFADAGRAYGAGESFSAEDLDSDVGFGLRLKTWEAVVGRLDVAWSREDTRVLLRFGPSF